MSDEEYRKIFSKNLRYYLSMKEKTQSDLINDLGLKSSTVSNWCTGQKLPRMNAVQMLADYFGIEKSDLIEERDKTVKQKSSVENLEEEFPEGVQVLRRATTELNPQARAKMIKLMKAFLDDEE